MSLARSRTQTVPFGDGRTNHDTTEAGRANLLDYSFQKEKVKHAYLENCRDVVDFVFDVCQIIDYLRYLFTRHILLLST